MKLRPPLDRQAFEKLRRIAPTQLEARRDPADWGARPLPEELAFKLTNRCDLRCAHCYQWNDQGYHRRLSAEESGDLSLPIIAKVLKATRELRSNVFLWGGEPMLYREWNGLMDLLAADRRWTTICTNGTFVERCLASLLPISSQTELLLAIDGFEPEHDALRGKGAFSRTLAALRLLVNQKRAGVYRGEISVNCLISDPLVIRLFQLVEFLESEGAETVILSLPWYLSDETSAKMDAFFALHFPDRLKPAQPSWHSYKFRLDPASQDDLRHQLARLDRAHWRLKLRYNPALSSTELGDFLRGGDKPAQGKTRCLALRTRLEVFPTGEAVSCKFFPEFTVGNLRNEAVAEVWHSGSYNRIRETVATCGLMPVCAQCNLLYSRGA